MTQVIEVKMVQHYKCYCRVLRVYSNSRWGKKTFPHNMFALSLMFTLCRYLSVDRALAVSLDIL